MEIEMKFTLPDKALAEALWEDGYLASVEEEGSREKVFMKACYFDTRDFLLRKRDIAFRTRLEGDRVTASLKWSGKSEGPLHRREEINVPVDDEGCLLKPDAEIFRESRIGREVLEMIGDAPLENVMETRFLRSRFRVETDDSIIEVSLDQGEIFTDRGNLPILELELELFSGSPEALSALAAILLEKYPLIPEARSKYARGLELLSGGAAGKEDGPPEERDASASGIPCERKNEPV